jgi:DNA-binding CsgD family transcriptional regulator
MRLLTAREKQIALLVAQGLSNPQISARLRIAEQTVKNHLRGVFRKLAVKNRVQLTLKMSSGHPGIPEVSGAEARSARRLRDLNQSSSQI